MRPYDADTQRKVCELECDNVTIGATGVFVDGDEVSFHQSERGVASAVSIPFKDFRRIVDWYMSEQRPRLANPAGKGKS